MHQDPVTKSQRITNGSGAITSTIDLDPWGGETSRSSNQAFQPHRYTTYERDSNGGDEAMMRRYAGKWHRFVQPDPYDGNYDWTNPQSFNRYTYVQNDPVNFIDPSGLDPDIDIGTFFAGNTVAEPGMVGTLGFDGELGMVITPTKPEMPEPVDPQAPTKPRKKLDPSNPVCQALAKR